MEQKQRKMAEKDRVKKQLNPKSKSVVAFMLLFHHCKIIFGSEQGQVSPKYIFLA